MRLYLASYFSSFRSTLLFTHLLAAVVAFQIGLFFAFYVHEPTTNSNDNESSRRLSFSMSSKCSSMSKSKSSSPSASQRSQESLLFSTATKNFATTTSTLNNHYSGLVDVPLALSTVHKLIGGGTATINLRELRNITRTGFPLSYLLPEKHIDKGNAQALVLYPPNYENENKEELSLSLSRCRHVKHVINPVSNQISRNGHSCTVIVGQQHAESHHVSKWINDVDVDANKNHNNQNQNHTNDETLATAISSSWRRVSRYEFAKKHAKNNGHLTKLPREYMTREGFSVLCDYLSAFVEAMKKLRPIAAQVANAGSSLVQGSMIVLVSNFGNSELFLNFICTARASGVDLTKILMFATDKETYALATSMGIATFYDSRIFASIPSAASGRYGDTVYGKIMMSKVYCVQMISQLGYNFLFSDVDIMIYKPHYLEWFIDQAQTEPFDIFFQHDFNHRAEYAPWVSNSGCYYAVNNDVTKALFTDMIYQGDLVAHTHSHQATLHTVLSEMSSLYGLRVKNLVDDHEKLPIGYHFKFQPSFMKNLIFSNRSEQLSFHVNWNSNKDFKRQYLEQLGSWYLTDACAATAAAANMTNTTTTIAAATISTCCSDQPLIQCHFRDRPSVIPCNESPFSTQRANAFW